ncbi:MAG TPA: alpha-L-arabinofuranosidase C-terminal domain-containing protein [Paludibaculum sp.]|jgi:alpha-N-arabinofuranosidase
MKHIACALLALIPAFAAPVTVDTTKSGAPISKYIYGQFIEHLGRCIYGGIWAEMLEDRKFFFPVNGEAPAWEMYTPGKRSFDGEGHPYELLTRSPWMVIGPKSGVKMVKAGAYVGEHTPEVTKAGLMQERLALRAGREYVGRVVLAGSGAVSVSLVWGGGATMRQTVVIPAVTGEYAKYPVRFRAGGATDNGRLEIVAAGAVRIGTASLMPADNIYGWRADTVALLKELNAPVYRWPGGNFVSGYNWRDGIGDMDRRPPRKNPAWKGIEHNDVGIHEYMTLMREIGAEPFVAVNTGLADDKAASEEVEYLNGSAATKLGKLRGENGHPAPYGVKWFAVGNEMYGDWQLGHMPLSEYVKKHNRVVAAMRQVDPAIAPIGVGAVGQWSEQMLTQCADAMTLISEHVYWQNKQTVEEHVAQTVDSLRKVAEAHRAYRQKIPALQGKDIRIAMDEWNFWYGPNDFGELGTRYFVQDGLGIAAGLHEFFRNSDIFFMANYAQTVNVIGAIKTTPTAAEMETTGLVLKLYRERFGVTPVAVTGVAAPLDVVAAWTADKSALTVAIVNPTTTAQTVSLDLKGAALTGEGMSWVIAGRDRMAHNDPGRRRTVDIVSEPVRGGTGELKAPALGVALYELRVR